MAKNKGIQCRSTIITDQNYENQPLLATSSFFVYLLPFFLFFTLDSHSFLEDVIITFSVDPGKYQLFVSCLDKINEFYSTAN
jgi:hypothetical protein